MRRRLPLTLMACLAAAGLTASGATAFFAADGQLRASARSGALSLSGVATEKLDGTGLRPGAPARTTRVVARNEGTIFGRLLLRVPDGVRGALPAALRLEVLTCESTSTCDAPVSVSDTPLPDADGIDLGELQPGEGRAVLLRLRWPAETYTDALANATGDLDLRWTLRTQG